MLRRYVMYTRKRKRESTNLRRKRLKIQHQRTELLLSELACKPLLYFSFLTCKGREIIENYFNQCNIYHLLYTRQFNLLYIISSDDLCWIDSWDCKLVYSLLIPLVKPQQITMTLCGFALNKGVKCSEKLRYVGYIDTTVSNPVIS